MTRTKEEIQKIVESLGYELLDEYMDKNFRRIVVQDFDGYRYDVQLNSLIAGYIPDFVAKSNPFVLSNIFLWLKKENKPFVLCEGNIYKGSGEKLFFQCLEESCQEIFDTSWEEIYSLKCGCPFCVGQRAGKYNNLEYLRPDLTIEWDYEKNQNSPSDYTEFSDKKVSWICLKCNHPWEAQIKSRSNGRGCPKCSQSKGEKKIYNFLVEHNVKFKDEFPLDGCRYKGQLYLDFYLSDYRIAIEYNGKHHYEPVRFSYSILEEQAKENLRLQKKKDKIKEKYCRDNDIRLLVIPYWEFDNIEKIMKDTFLL